MKLALKILFVPVLILFLLGVFIFCPSALSVEKF
jgi:hypothetical protein